MTIKELLTELARRTGLPELALDDTGVCRLVFDGQVSVDLEPAEDGESLHLHTILGNVPPEGKPQLFHRLLAANFLGRGTGGAVLAVEPQEGIAFLFRTLPMQTLVVDEFVDLLAGFVHAARDWAAKLDAPPEPPPQSGPDASHAGMIRV